MAAEAGENALGHLNLVTVGRMYEHAALFDTMVTSLEEKNATPELGWDGEHHVTTGGARAMADALLLDLTRAGYRIERAADIGSSTSPEANQ